MTVGDVRVLVVGAGLAGLCAADRLRSEGLTVQVVEARTRVGGRLMTVESESPVGGRFDLGATWHWPGQPEVAALAESLGLGSFAQFAGGSGLHEHPGQPAAHRIDGAGEPPPLRLDGGCQALAQRLADRLPAEWVTLGVAAVSVEATGSGLAVATAAVDGRRSTVAADFVVVAVPPRLVLRDIAFTPPLPDDLADVMRRTPTWMADVVKCVVVYERPFWRDSGFSGSVFSAVGPLREVHDASGRSGAPAGLWGLLADDPTLLEMDPGERVPLVLAQLERLFGPEASRPVDYFERDWSSDPNTSEIESDPHVQPLGFGHPLLSRPLLQGRLLWAGAETVEVGGGHMEGAVRSGRRAAELVLARRP